MNLRPSAYLKCYENYDILRVEMLLCNNVTL